MSVGTVSSNLPHEEEFHGSDTPSEHAAAMREYRAYERMQKERQVQEGKEQDMDSIQNTRVLRKESLRELIISYDPLWKKLIDLGLSKTQMAEKAGIS